MLDMAFDFYFPRLVYRSESTLIHNRHHHGHIAPDDWSEKTHKKVQLYRLDWEGFDAIKMKKFWDWHAKYKRLKTLQYVPGLPDKYNEVIGNLVFHLDHKYLAEIRHCCQMAFMERCKQRGFDTVIRDICQEPAIAYVFVAFRLICDCIFDEKRHYYREHDWVRCIAYHAMLYNFWDKQTGRGLVWERAHMDKLESFPTSCEYQQRSPVVMQFYEDMKVHNQLATDTESVIKTAAVKSS